MAAQRELEAYLESVRSTINKQSPGTTNQTLNSNNNVWLHQNTESSDLKREEIIITSSGDEDSSITSDRLRNIKITNDLTDVEEEEEESKGINDRSVSPIESWMISSSSDEEGFNALHGNIYTIEELEDQSNQPQMEEKLKDMASSHVTDHMTNHVTDHVTNHVTDHMTDHVTDLVSLSRNITVDESSDHVIDHVTELTSDVSSVADESSDHVTGHVTQVFSLGELSLESVVQEELPSDYHVTDHVTTDNGSDYSSDFEDEEVEESRQIDNNQRREPDHLHSNDIGTQTDTHTLHDDGQQYCHHSTPLRTPLRTPLLPPESLQVLSNYPPGVLALQDLVKSHLTLTRHLINQAQALSQSVVSNTNPDYQYTTVTSTKQVSLFLLLTLLCHSYCYFLFLHHENGLVESLIEYLGAKEA
jgi:hypothetical protein